MNSKFVVSILLVSLITVLFSSIPAGASTNLIQSLLPVDCVVDQVFDGTNSTTSINPQSCREYIDSSADRSSLGGCTESVSSDSCNALEEINSISVSRKSMTDEKDEVCQSEELSQEQTTTGDRKSCLCWIILLIVTNCLTLYLTRTILLKNKSRKDKLL